MFPSATYKSRNNSAACIVALIATLMGGVCIGEATAADRLHFSDLQGIHDWRKKSNAAVFVQDKDLQWYEALLDAACMKYVSSGEVRFITEAGGDDEPKRVSKIIVGQRICNVTSLTPTESPGSKNP